MFHKNLQKIKQPCNLGSYVFLRIQNFLQFVNFVRTSLYGFETLESQNFIFYEQIQKLEGENVFYKTDKAFREIKMQFHFDDKDCSEQ